MKMKSILVSAATVFFAVGCNGGSGQKVENSYELCHDSQDNDGDGLTDCDDQDCSTYCEEHENTAILCSDGTDNDGDGFTDCDDQDCHAFCDDATTDVIDDQPVDTPQEEAPADVPVEETPDTCSDNSECDDGFACTDDFCNPDTHLCENPVSSAGTVCREAAGPCDAEEACTGTSVDCPEDLFAAVGTPCDDGDHCTGSDVCDGAGGCSGDDTGRLNDVVAAGGGDSHTCAVLENGAVKCWGYGIYGNLGDGTTESRLTPVDVFGLGSGVSAISAGYYHTCALLDSGGMKCWGRNQYGQLGDGTTEDRLVPTDVLNLSPGVISMHTKYSFSCAALDTGAARCWGYNNSGQLGDGTTVDKHTPVDVSGLSSGVASIYTGRDHACALLDMGAVKCWGSNYYGQLGDGTTVDKHTPVDVSGLSSGVITMAMGGLHTCAVMDTGALKCWGYNTSGQLGDGTITERHTPVDVTGLSSGVTAVACGGGYTCVLLDTGAMKCWGSNQYGQLGDGTTTDRHAPVDVTGLGAGVSSIAVGIGHTCAVTDTTVLKCWGHNHRGELGDGTTTNRYIPTDVLCE